MPLQMNLVLLGDNNSHTLAEPIQVGSSIDLEVKNNLQKCQYQLNTLGRTEAMEFQIS